MMQNVFKELGALLAGLLSRGSGLWSWIRPYTQTFAQLLHHSYHSEGVQNCSKAMPNPSLS